MADSEYEMFGVNTSGQRMSDAEQGKAISVEGLTSDCHVEVQHLSSVIRICHAGRGCTSRDTYEWSCALLWLKPDSVEIVGVDKEMTLQVGKALRNWFKGNKLGIKFVYYSRKGVLKRKEV